MNEPPIIDPGDEPDRAYDVATPRAALSSPGLHPIPFRRPLEPELHVEPWDGSIVRSLIIPTSLILADLVISVAGVAVGSGDYHGFWAALRFTAISQSVRIPLLLVTCVGIGRLMDVAFGQIGPFLLKVCAIAGSWNAVVGIVLLIGACFGVNLEVEKLDTLARHGGLGSMAVLMLTLVGFFPLFFYLFDWPYDDESARFVAIAWASQACIGMFVLHMLIQPPPVTPHYVDPAHPFHFSIGN